MNLPTAAIRLPNRAEPLPIDTQIAPASAEAFPPAGWMTNRQAAERLGVALETLTISAWKWCKTLKSAKQTVRMPGGGRCNLYRMEVIERIAQTRAEAARGPVIPEGYVDKTGAAKFFGVTVGVWEKWVVQGRVRFGQEVPAAKGARRKIYAIADLETMRESQFGRDKYFKRGDQTYHIPPGYLRREEAWEKFGVGMTTWARCEREGKITCAIRVGYGPKLYREDMVRWLVEENGKLTPPYEDPDRPGVWRVPLGGLDIKRREAIVDADVVTLIEGGHCHWCEREHGGYVSFGNAQYVAVPLRRLILGVIDETAKVRHLNGDGLDCRRENLVLRTMKQTCHNARKVKSVKGRATSSIFKGVHWESYTRRWRAAIRVDGKTIGLGRHDDQMQAAAAYDEAAKQYFGEHARLNFPNGINAWLEEFHGLNQAA